MHQCLGKHSCTSNTFPIAIMNGTCLFARGEIGIALVEAFAKQKLINKLNLGPGGGWMICQFSYLSPFCFCQLNFTVLFPFRIKYNHILFLIIGFGLGYDKLVSCFFYCLSLFILDYSSLFCFLLIEILYTFQSLI